MSGGIGFESLFVFFKLSAFFMIALVGFGFSCFLTLGTALNSLESLFDSPTEWTKNYGENSPLEQVKDLTTVFY